MFDNKQNSNELNKIVGVIVDNPILEEKIHQ